MTPPPDDVAAALRVLAHLIASPEACDADPLLARVRQQASSLMRSCRDGARRRDRGRDREVLDSTLQNAIPAAPAAGALPELRGSRNCYACRRPFSRVHFFYASLCPECAEFNYRKRGQTADLCGRVAVVTGGRVKVGYQVVLSLLRAGANVEATTRFPRDAARRYAAEPDFAEWAGRLGLHGLDLRALGDIQHFADRLAQRHGRLDVLVNNAAQTVRRPPAYYRDLIEGERAALPDRSERLLASPEVSPGGPAARSQLPLLASDVSPGEELFPPGRQDAFGQQLDLRERTSWTLELHEVELGELVEVHVVNSLAPFVLLRHLDGLLQRHPEVPRFVVNVTSVEGNFSADTGKNGRHPHTNMSKAAMNMITRTCAEPYARRGVYVNSVDPGWVSNEAPLPHAEAMRQAGFREPLDLADAAARVLDPVFTALNTGVFVSGKLFKDYAEVGW